MAYPRIEGLRRVRFSHDVLFRLGLERGGHYEVILTSVNPSTSMPNAMAVGLTCGDDLEIAVFSGSDTFQYLRSSDKVWICIPSCSQMDLLVRAAVWGHGTSVAEFPSEMYAEGGGVPRLLGLPALLCIAKDREVKSVSDAYGKGEVMRITLSPIEALISHGRWTPVSRAPYLLLEAAIRISRGMHPGEILEKAAGLAAPSLQQLIEAVRHIADEGSG